jgi:hypothetical protein
MIRKQTKVWRTASGEKVRICDMTNQHLVNAIRCLNQIAEGRYQSGIDIGYSMLTDMRGEMAIDHLEAGLIELENTGMEQFLPDIYYNMLDEFNRRKLNPKQLEGCYGT